MSFGIYHLKARGRTDINLSKKLLIYCHHWQWFIYIFIICWWLLLFPQLNTGFTTFVCIIHGLPLSWTHSTFRPYINMGKIRVIDITVLNVGTWYWLGHFWDRWPSLAGKLSWDLTTTQVNSALHPSRVTKSSNSFSWGKGRKVNATGWPVTLCDPIMACNFPLRCGDFDYELLYPIYFTLLPLPCDVTLSSCWMNCVACRERMRLHGLEKSGKLMISPGQVH